MAHQCYLPFLIIVLVGLCIKDSESSLIRRFNYDARLYEHFAYDSRYIQYSRSDPEEWKNLTALTEARNYTFSSMICTSGPGAWIFYPDAGYSMGNSLRYYLIIGEHCIRADDIDSIQPIGKMDEFLSKGVVLFPKPIFGDVGTTIVGEGSGEGGSMIFTGDVPHQISGSGQTICLQPGVTDFDYGYCMIPDLKASFGIEGSVAVKENCGNDTSSDEMIIIVQNCYEMGVHEIYTDSDLTSDKLAGVCAGGGDLLPKAKFTILMEMWGLRLGSSEIFTKPAEMMPENSIKIQILWTILEIFKTSCPAVDEMYVFLLGHLFLRHLRQSWKNGNTTEINDESWRFTDDFLAFCMSKTAIVEVDSMPAACRDSDKFGRLAEGMTPETASWYEIVNGEAFDTVIEQMWLIINYIIPTCSNAAGYTTNDWSDMVLFFHQAFLDPLGEIWTEPGDWLRLYPAVFHGFDIREEHQNILECLEGALAATPAFDPIGRPRSFRDIMIYKHAIPEDREVKPAQRKKREHKNAKSTKARK
ncbi:unnamed protein product [Orchesella dallaii]|uniref:Uncharacterized protein n=1 Tax=Orchesella dallaii TaxID=48710 RepID=A0ABP1QTS3_9HEXA